MDSEYFYYNLGLVEVFISIIFNILVRNLKLRGQYVYLETIVVEECELFYTLTGGFLKRRKRSTKL